MKVINLKFDKTIKDLAGYPYGETVFNEQVRNLINYNDAFEIVFPEQIDDVAISFVQGFYNEILEHMGYERSLNDVRLKSLNPDVDKRNRLINKIHDCI